MADLNTDVRYIKGVGEAKAKALGKLGIATLGDLIAWFPHRYEDRRETKPVSQLIPGETACVAAMIAAEPKLSHIRKGMDLVKVRAVDDTGVLDVTFFNQPWLKNQLHVGETYIFYGKAEGSLLRKNMAGPIVEPEGPAGTHRPHRAGVSSDRRGQPTAAVTGHPAGTGRLRRHSAGLPAGRRAAGPPALPGELRLREHPLSGIPGGAGHCPAASGF